MNRAISRRKKVPIHFTDPEDVCRWISETWFRDDAKYLPTVHLPANSKFRNLKIPNGKKLTTKKSIVDEGIRQHFAPWKPFDLFKYLNSGEATIWSIDENNRHYTLIVTSLGRSKTFTVHDLFWENGQSDLKKQKEIESYLKTQTPFVDPKR